MSLSKTRIGVAPLSNRIVLARFGKNSSVALETRDAMSEFWQALVQYSFDGKMPEQGKAVEVSFGGGNEQFSFTIRRKHQNDMEISS
ncbi:hypothetical protein [Rhizobium sp. Root651]|uniref:hypothetical protein n=1 Tax=Rhizobium sp. Root651 TaxID=1736577 RepID=UPI0012E3F16A|nr:hypothetical protein [Rhizobium sp. Root651]